MPFVKFQNMSINRLPGSLAKPFLNSVAEYKPSAHRFVFGVNPTSPTMPCMLFGGHTIPDLPIYKVTKSNYSKEMTFDPRKVTAKLAMTKIAATRQVLHDPECL